MIQNCINLIFSRANQRLLIPQWILSFHLSGRHLKQEEELFRFCNVAVDVLEEAHLWQSVIDIRIAFLLHLMKVRGLVNSKPVSNRRIESLHDPGG